jgi:hypothetical protein
MAEYQQKLTTGGGGNAGTSDDDNILLVAKGLDEQIVLVILFIEAFREIEILGGPFFR